ncbi:MAG TPA: NDP-sugar synthase [Vicinamibacterales bacterium]|nr:NDP-sugar synthase [Vicinamibacterales bacterium]
MPTERLPLAALVLSAGRGTRLDPITRLVAKPAVPLGELTLIERVLGWLRRSGVGDVVVNLHARPATITRVVGDGAHVGLSVRYSWEPRPLGSAGGPRRALPLLATDPVLIVNGDTLADVNLPAMLDAHRQSGADVTMALVPNPAPAHYNGVAIDDEGRVTGFVPRGQAAGTWHFIGVQIAAASVFADLPDGEPVETVSGIYRDLIAARPGAIRAWRATGAVLDVGTPSDYLDAALSFVTHRAGRHPGARLRHTFVWPEATVGAGADLDQCVVAGPVVIPAGFTASQSVIVPASIVEAGDTVEIRDGLAMFPLSR